MLKYIFILLHFKYLSYPFVNKLFIFLENHGYHILIVLDPYIIWRINLGNNEMPIQHLFQFSIVSNSFILSYYARHNNVERLSKGWRVLHQHCCPKYILQCEVRQTMFVPITNIINEALNGDKLLGAWKPAWLHANYRELLCLDF